MSKAVRRLSEHQYNLHMTLHVCAQKKIQSIPVSLVLFKYRFIGLVIIYHGKIREEHLASNNFKRIKCNFTHQAMLLAYNRENSGEKIRIDFAKKLTFKRARFPKNLLNKKRRSNIFLRTYFQAQRLMKVSQKVSLHTFI